MTRLSDGRFAVSLGVVLAAITVAAHAQTPTPAGLWKTFDDDTGRPKSLVRVVERDCRLTGRIEKLLDPDDPADGVCDRCSDERRNQPILGLTILRNVRRSDGRSDLWEGGDILDPENGKVYHVRLLPSADGRHLDVRGYVGTPLFGRTQTWQRAE